MAYGLLQFQIGTDTGGQAIEHDSSYRAKTVI